MHKNLLLVLGFVVTSVLVAAPQQRHVRLGEADERVFRSTAKLGMMRPLEERAMVVVYANEALPVDWVSDGRAECFLVATKVGYDVEILSSRVLTPEEVQQAAEKAMTAVVDAQKRVNATLRAVKRPNQSPEPTAMSVTPPAAQEPRQP